jgi:hypothetical protein
MSLLLMITLQMMTVTRTMVSLQGVSFLFFSCFGTIAAGGFDEPAADFRLGGGRGIHSNHPHSADSENLSPL